MSVTPPASMALAVRDFRYSSTSGGIVSPRALRSSASKRAMQARISSKNAMGFPWKCGHLVEADLVFVRSSCPHSALRENVLRTGPLNRDAQPCPPGTELAVTAHRHEWASRTERQRTGHDRAEIGRAHV